MPVSVGAGGSTEPPAVTVTVAPVTSMSSASKYVLSPSIVASISTAGSIAISYVPATVGLNVSVSNIPVPSCVTVFVSIAIIDVASTATSSTSNPFVTVGVPILAG